MKTNLTDWKNTMVVCLATMLASVPVLADPKLKQSAAKPSSPAIAKKEAGGGTSEKLKVSGAWTIVVRNADGSVASRHQFNNALVYHGARDITRMLALRDPFDLPRAWYVAFGGGLSFSDPNSPCLDFRNLPEVCFVRTAGGGGHAGAHSLNLVVSAPTSGADVGRMVLEGSVKSQRAGQITQVGTHATFAAFSTWVTHHLLSAPIVVEANQTIDVKVVLGFS